MDIKLSKNDIYILIYEKNKIYEHLILYKNYENKTSVLFQDNNEKIENIKYETIKFNYLEYNNKVDYELENIIYIPENNIVGYIENKIESQYIIRIITDGSDKELNKSKIIPITLDNLIIDKLMKFINKKILIGEKEFSNFNEMSKIMKNYEFSCGYYDITKRITHMGYKKRWK